MYPLSYKQVPVMSAVLNLPPPQTTGTEAGLGHALPAGHAVQLDDAPPSEYMPDGHGVGAALKIKYFVFKYFYYNIV